VFVGYGSCEKGYRVYDLKSEKVVLSRSVIFSEDRAWNWERNLMNQNHLSLNLEGGEVESENFVEDLAAAQPDNIEHCHQKSTVGELAENIDSDNSQQSSPSSTPVKLKTLQDIYARCHMCIMEGNLIIVSIYVDDIVYTGSSERLLSEFKREMMQRYEMSDLGLLHHFLGMGILQTDQGVFIHQSKYAKSLLNKFGLDDCKPVSIPLATSEKLKKVDGSELADEGLYRRIVGVYYI
jgi:hypothetical protein